ncbi:MAG: protein kinase, partial [Candidatus Obscuribacterales bacterium]|nr:protein kinase [Candidatus Obscuribacterales bacterium]
MTEPSDNSSGSTCLQCGKPLTSCTCATVFVSGEEAIVGSEEGGRRGLSRGDVLDGRYRIVRIIGTGGMGTVYEAEHVVLLNRVALKIMRPEFLSDRMVTARFEQEARACAALTHANLVSVQDCGATDNGEPYLVMEFLQGHNLIEIINVEKRLDLDRFFGIFLPVVKGLSYAHQNGVIHRDLKPGNIIIIEGPEGRDLPKIVDFGVAKLDDLGPAMQMLTQTGEVFGSPSYMSPEQCKGLPVDARSDIYSLGCVMYEALTGKQAFAGHNIMTILHSQLNEAPKELTAAIGDDSIPEALVDVIMQCLEKEREDRFDSCEDLLAHMQKAKDDMLGSYRLSFGRLRMSGENLLAYLVALAVVVGLLASWLFFHGESSHIGSHKFPEGVETRALVKSLVATYSEIQEFDDYARKSYQESLKSAIAGKASPETQVVLALPLIRLLRHSRRYDEAVNVYQQVKPALDAMRTTGDVDSIARPAANAGSMLFYYAAESLEKKKETDRAIETFQFGVEFSEKLQASAWVKAKLYEQYGKSIEDKKQFVDTARKCFENVIELLDGETDDIKDECRGMRARAHLSLANIFEAKKKFDLSSREFDQAIKIYQAGKEKDNENRSREKLVQFLIRRKDYQAARVEAEAMFAHPGVSKTLLMNLPSIKSVSPMVLADRGVFLKKERLPGYEASLLAALDRADKAKLDDLDKLSIAFLLMTGYF